MKLGHDYQYPIKGSGVASYNLESEKYLMGMRVAFVDGQALMWPKGKIIDDATMIRQEEKGLYKLNE